MPTIRMDGLIKLCTIEYYPGLEVIKRDDFDFEIVNFPFLDGDVPRSIHPMESISLNSFVLLENLAILLTSTLAINC